MDQRLGFSLENGGVDEVLPPPTMRCRLPNMLRKSTDCRDELARQRTRGVLPEWPPSPLKNAFIVTRQGNQTEARKGGTRRHIRTQVGLER